MNLSPRFQVIAVNDSSDFCECCGRKGLKRVVWVLDNETGEQKHFGTTCVLAPSKAFGVNKEVQSAIRQFAHEQAVARKVEWLNRVKYNKAAA